MTEYTEYVGCSHSDWSSKGAPVENARVRDVYPLARNAISILANGKPRLVYPHRSILVHAFLAPAVLTQSIRLYYAVT